VQRFLGEGAKKRVYLARDTRLERDVAIALIKGEGLDEAARARVRREVQTMGRLGDHPDIVTVFDVFDDAGLPCIVSEYMAGGSVEDLLAAAPGHRLPLADVLRLGVQVCRALEHAHAADIIHRDVKPANVWLAAGGDARLGDFGLAVALDRTRLSLAGTMVGTVAYMAPEQALGKAPDARSDLYSLGAMLYELVTGRPPFLGDDAVAVISQHIYTQPVAPSWHSREVPRALEEVVLRLLAKGPEARPESAAAVRAALSAISVTAAGEAARAGRPDANPLEGLASGTFVGRDRELGELRAALERALASEGRVAMVSGEPGIGKTRLAEELDTYAQLRGVRVLRGACHEGEGAPAFWPWVQVIRSYVHERAPAELLADMGPGAAAIAQIVSVVRERLPELPELPTLEPAQARFRLFDSVTSFLRSAAVRSPMLILLDDLQWADTPSLLLLEFLASELEGARLLVVGAYRDTELGRQHPLAQTLAQLAREGRNERVALGGLSQGDVARFIQLTAGMAPPAQLVATVHRKTEGNPFFVTELVRLLAAEHRLAGNADSRSWSVSIPQGVRDVLLRRLDRLSPESRQGLTLGAGVGHEMALETRERLADVPADGLLEALEEAVNARILVEVPRAVGAYGFAHALVRETLYAELGATRRARLHRRVGDILEGLHSHDRDRHLAELAHHFLEGARDGSDPARAVDYATRAGERAMAQLAYEEAAAHYEAALGALEARGAVDRGQRCELLLALGEARARAGDVSGARESFTAASDLARRQGAAEALARAALGFAGPWGEAGVLDTAVLGRLEEALAAAGAADSALRARVLGRLAVELYWSDDADRRAALSAEALAIARRLDDPRTLAFVLYCRHWVLWGPGTAEERLAVAREIVRQAGRVGDAEMAVHGHTEAIIDLMELGDIAGVDQELAAHACLAEELRQPLYFWYAALMRAMRAALEGRFADAEASAFEALAIGQRGRHHNATLLFGAQSFPLAAAQGKLEQLEGGLAALQALVLEHPAVPAWRAGLAFTYALLGRQPEARTEFERLAARDFADVPRDMSWLTCVNTLADVCAQLSEVEHAATLYRLLLPHAGRNVVAGGAVFCFGPVDRTLGLLAGVLGRLDEAAAHFAAAVAMSTRMGARPFVAQAQVDWAALLVTRDGPGDREQALRLLGPALATAESLGMKQLLEQALAQKLRAQGTAPASVRTSIDAVSAAVQRERTELRPHAAPDGTVTILFSDIESFTAMTERLGDVQAHKVLQAHNAIVREQVAAHGGFEVKSQGDGFMLAFPSARRALRCAVGMQRAMQARALRQPEPLRIRIGLHTGEAIREADDFFGRHVILAARIAAQADGGTILTSALVKELTASTGEFTFGPGWDVELKGISGPQRVYAVEWAA
jgi:class 3 adenylate cyclase